MPSDLIRYGLSAAMAAALALALPSAQAQQAPAPAVAAVPKLVFTLRLLLPLSAIVKFAPSANDSDELNCTGLKSPAAYGS